MTPSLERLSTKAKEAPSPHEVRLALLDTNPIFQCLRELSIQLPFIIFYVVSERHIAATCSVQTTSVMATNSR